jgi:sporulation-control protein
LPVPATVRTTSQSHGRDAFGRFTVDSASVDRTDWVRQLDGRLRQTGRRRGLV